MSAYSDNVIADGAALYWRLNDVAGNAADSGPNSLTGVAAPGDGSLTYAVPGVLPTGLATRLTPGTTGPLFSVASAAPINFGTGNFTVEGWIKVTSNVTSPRTSFPAGKGAPAAAVAGWRFSEGYNATGLAYKISDAVTFLSGVCTFDATHQPKTWFDRWIHLVAVFNRASVLTFYVNGTAQTNTVTISTAAGSIDNAIACVFGGVAGWQLDGDVSDFALYPIALTAAQILTHYQLGTVQYAVPPLGLYGQKVLADGALGYWRLDEATGDALDSSGNGRTLTVTGSPTYRVSGAISDGDPAVSFPGGGLDEFARADAALRPTAGVTLELWFKPSAFPAVQYLAGAGDTGSNGYRLTADAAPIVIFSVGNGSTAVSVGSSVQLVVGRWYHIVGTYDGTNVRLYLNTLLVGGPIALAGPIAYGAVTQFVVAQLDGATAARQATGVLDEVAVFGTALTAAQVNYEYQLGLWRGINEHLQIYLTSTLGYVSTDLTTNINRRLAALTGDMTARFKAMVIASGTKN